jgi:hypothetical protein
MNTKFQQPAAKDPKKEAQKFPPRSKFDKPKPKPDNPKDHLPNKNRLKQEDLSIGMSEEFDEDPDENYADNPSENSYTQLNKNSEAVKWTLEKLRDHFIDNDLDFDTLYDQICDIVAKVFVGVENNFTDPVNRMPDHR